MPHPACASPAGGEAHYNRNGTSSQFAALDTEAGSSAGSSTMSKPTCPTIPTSTSSWTPPQPARRTRRPRRHVHFTPTSAFWLNQIKRFFAELTEKPIRRGVQGVDCGTGKGDPSPHRHRQQRSQSLSNGTDPPMTSSRPSNGSARERSRPHNMPDNYRNFRIGTHIRSRTGSLYRTHQGRHRPGPRRGASHRDHRRCTQCPRPLPGVPEKTSKGRRGPAFA